MNALDDFSKAFVILTGALWGFAAFEFGSSLYRENMWILLLALMITLAVTMFAYMKRWKKEARPPA
jgi:hypothetical protein